MGGVWSGERAGDGAGPGGANVETNVNGMISVVSGEVAAVGLVRGSLWLSDSGQSGCPDFPFHRSRQQGR